MVEGVDGSGGWTGTEPGAAEIGVHGAGKWKQKRNRRGWCREEEAGRLPAAPPRAVSTHRPHGRNSGDTKETIFAQIGPNFSLPRTAGTKFQPPPPPSSACRGSPPPAPLTAPALRLARGPLSGVAAAEGGRPGSPFPGPPVSHRGRGTPLVPAEPPTRAVGAALGPPGSASGPGPAAAAPARKRRRWLGRRCCCCWWRWCCLVLDLSRYFQPQGIALLLTVP